MFIFKGGRGGGGKERTSFFFKESKPTFVPVVIYPRNKMATPM